MAVPNIDEAEEQIADAQADIEEAKRLAEQEKAAVDAEAESRKQAIDEKYGLT